MRTTNPYFKHQVYINTAILAAYLNLSDKGFRQKDVKFYIELLSNWMESTFSEHGIIIQNTQVQRILNELVLENILVKTNQGKNPYYNIKPIGLIELLNRIVSSDMSSNLEDFFFLYHIVTFYNEKLEMLLDKDQITLSQSYRTEFKFLLNKKLILEKQKQSILKEIEKLEIRIKEAKRMTEVANDLKKKGKSLNEIIKVISTNYPYQLNNQKIMMDLFKELRSDIQMHEITDGPLLRAQTLWEPLLSYYKNYMNILNTLK